MDGGPVATELQTEVVGRQLRALASSAVRLTSLLDTERVVTTVVDVLVREFDAALARVWLYGADAQTYTLQAQAGDAEPTPILHDGVVPYDEMVGWLTDVSRRHTPVVLGRAEVTRWFDATWLRQERIAGAAAFPLGSSDRFEGILIYYTRHDLTPGAIEVLRAFAAIVTTSLHDARRLTTERMLRAAAEEATARLQAVQSVLDTALVERPPRETMLEVLKRLREVLHSDTATVLLLDEQRAALHVFASLGLEGYRTQEVAIPFGAGYAGTIAATGRPWIVDDTETIERVSPWLKGEVRSVMGAPLWLEGQVVGVVHVGSHTLRRFTPDDLILLQLVAERLGAVLERTRLHEAERRARAEAEAAQNRFAFLAEASRALSSSLDYHTTLKTVAQQVVPRLATWCIIDVVEESGEVRRLEVAQGDPEKTRLAEEMQRRFPPAGGAGSRTTDVIRSGEPIVIADLTDEVLRATSRSEEHLAMLLRLELRSYMCVPMIAAGTTLGAITFLATGTDRPYGQDELMLALDVAGRAASAVQNARLFAQVQNAVRMRDEFLTMVSHDLKSPLAAIKGRAQVLQRRVRSLEIEERERMESGLASIDATSTRMTRLIDNLMDVARLRVGQPLELRRECTDLVALTREVIDEVAETTSITIELRATTATLTGRWDQARLERVLANLLSNAVKYSPGGGTIDVELEERACEGSQEAVLRVRDAGMGIPADDLPSIFERFRRGSNVGEGIPGSGVGLAGARQIVEQHGGTITAESIEGVGSTFTVVLPLG